MTENSTDSDNWAALNKHLASQSIKVDSLCEAIMALQNAAASNPPVAPSLPPIQSQSTPPGPPSSLIPKATLPDKFKGERSRTRGFINQLELAFKLNPSYYATDDIKVAIVGTLLSGHALAWYNPYLEKPENYQRELNSWPLFKTLFIESFGDPDAPQVAAHNIRTLTQGNRSVATYSSAFRLFQSDLDWNDSAFCSQFLAGLNDNISNMMMFSDAPNSLDAAVSLAIKCDNRLMQQRQSSIHPQIARTNFRQHERQHSKPVSDAMNIDALSIVPQTRRRGPLTAAERKLRLDNNLCLICASADHRRLTCPLARKISGITIDKNLIRTPLNASLINSKAPLSHATTQEIIYSKTEDQHRLTLQGNIRIGLHSLTAHCLVDSGADSNFISSVYVAKHSLATEILMSPIDLQLADGQPGVSGSITHRTCPLQLHLNGHVETISFLVTQLSGDVILGISWLGIHNPSILWSDHSIKFNSAYCLTTCCLSPVSISSGAAEKLAGMTSAVYPYIVGPEQNIDPIVPWQVSKEYCSVFSHSQSKMLPPHRSFDLSINLKAGSTPTFGRSYSLTVPETEAMADYVTENLAKGFIRPSKSPFGAPCFFVPKKDKSLRLCVDYRNLNSSTIKDRNPLPLISDLIRSLQGGRYFTLLDLRGAYNLIRIRSGDEYKTAFVTKSGQYEYLVMPFGLSNAPAVFQSMMNTILAPLLHKSVLVYLDDIVIYSNDINSHWKLVNQILSILLKHELYCNLPKCHFAKLSITYLGYVISNGGVSIDPAKVSSISTWPEPTSVLEVQSFLGFANFYRQFLPSYATLTAPFTQLLRKNSSFVWTHSHSKQFQTIKNAFRSGVELQHADEFRSFIVETDPSDYGIGGVLSQESADGTLRPIAFFSRQMLPAERNYEVYDKELLAVFICFKHWRHFLQGSRHPVTVLTDHLNLQYFMTERQLTRRQARWSLFFNEFNFVLTHRAGHLNGKADRLSRRADYKVKSEPTNFQRLLDPLKVISPVPNSSVQIPAATIISDIQTHAVKRVEVMPKRVEVLPKRVAVLQNTLEDSNTQFSPGILSSTSPHLINVSIGAIATPLPYDLLHRRLGHVSSDVLRKTIQCTSGLQVIPFSKTPICEPCILGKSTRSPRIMLGRPASSLLEIIETDTQGPFPIIARDGTCNNVKFIDAYSGYLKMETIENRSAATITAAFQRFQHRMERRTGKLIKYVRCDGGTEYKGCFLDHCESTGIIKQMGTPYAHTHPGRAERVHKTIMTRARAILLDSNLPSSYYADAQLTASYLHNRIIHGSNSLTPFEQVYGRRPDLSRLRPFGCISYALVPPELRSKLAATTARCRLIGFADDDDTEEYKGFKLLRESDYSIFYASDVRFDESAPMLALPGYPSATDADFDVVSIDASYDPATDEDLVVVSHDFPYTTDANAWGGVTGTDADVTEADPNLTRAPLLSLRTRSPSSKQVSFARDLQGTLL